MSTELTRRPNDPAYMLQTIFSRSPTVGYDGRGSLPASVELFVTRNAVIVPSANPETTNLLGVKRRVIGSYLAPMVLEEAEDIVRAYGSFTNEVTDAQGARTAIDTLMAVPRAQAHPKNDELILGLDLRAQHAEAELDAARSEATRLAIAGQDAFTAAALQEVLQQHNHVRQ